MAVRRVGVHAAVALLTLGLVLGVAGCRGDDEPASSGTTASASPSAQPTPPVPTQTALQQPQAGTTIEPTATLSAVPGASEMAAPKEAPRTIQGFPVPEGAKVKDPGAIDETWQFDIRTTEPDDVIAFYKRVLPQMGFKVRTDVTYTLGDEQVHWDLVFDGKVSGSMARDPDNGVVFVVVNPPGQKALAGE
ncbi:hypothetical protein [Marmoricola sp. RAF53]|uniref:hypothetical protein n=1 Tax=Marmoricola sp. RAF53 TaxID=3233059 RepID=UPI003F961084